MEPDYTPSSTHELAIRIIDLAFDEFDIEWKPSNEDKAERAQIKIEELIEGFLFQNYDNT